MNLIKRNIIEITKPPNNKTDCKYFFCINNKIKIIPDIKTE